ncbi:MAG TPA: DUF3043 domain-containing protein [Streptosporangiaceae bacterium]|nr:DUF3043 domain-containing protein [Streptosporangiaceae bacterium]
MFRRRSTNSPGVLDADQSAAEAEAESARPARSSVTPKKAGPTPKRSEAQGQRGGHYQAPGDRKAAGQGSKERDRSERNRRALALQRGEEWALPAKDKGPVRALARDVVDSRRGISEWYLVIVVPVFVLVFLHVPALQLVADCLVILVLLTVIGEGYYVGRKVERLARERYPGQSTRGVRFYAAMRGTQLRKMRMPKPRVDRGDPV